MLPLFRCIIDSYDILTGSGCFGENHIPSEALYEAIRIVKPGRFEHNFNKVNPFPHTSILQQTNWTTPRQKS